MKTLILLTLFLASCATKPVPRKDIEIKVISANVVEIRIPGASIDKIELEDGELDPSDTKANYSMVFFKEKDHFKGTTIKNLSSVKDTEISFKIRSKDQVEVVQARF